MDGNLDHGTDTPALESLLASVATTLKNSSGKDVFAVGGQLGLTDPCENPTRGKSPLVIRWESGNQHNKITLPVTADDESQRSFGKLLADCEPAMFGLGGENVYDEEYRKAGKLDEAKFCTSFSPYEHGIVDTVFQALGLSDSTNPTDHGIRAELYSFNIYSAPSGKFRSHVDTPRSTEQMGSLVVCLPYTHQGGGLVVRHAGREIVFDWGMDSSSMVQWAAFFSDCEHEVLEVTSGHRLTLTYNLFWTQHAPSMMARNLDALSQESLHFYEALKRVVEHLESLPQGGRLGFTCTHSYPHSAKATSTEAGTRTLKGLDMVVFQALSRLVPCVRVVAVIDQKYVSSQEASSVWVAGGLVHQAIDDNDDHMKRRFEPKHFESRDGRPLFQMKEVRWLNYSPGSAAHRELAVAFYQYGNDGSIGSFYSSAVIMAEVKGGSGKNPISD